MKISPYSIIFLITFLNYTNIMCSNNDIPQKDTSDKDDKKTTSSLSIFEANFVQYKPLYSPIEEKRVPKETLSSVTSQLIQAVGFKEEDTLYDLSLKYFKLGLSLFQAPIFPSGKILKQHAVEYISEFISHTPLTKETPFIVLQPLIAPGLIQHTNRETLQIGIEHTDNRLLVSYILTQLNPNSMVTIAKACFSFEIMEQEDKMVLNPEAIPFTWVFYEGEMFIDQEENEKKRLTRNIFILSGHYMKKYLKKTPIRNLNPLEKMDLKLSALRMYYYADYLSKQNPKMKKFLSHSTQPFLGYVKGEKYLSILNDLDNIKTYEEKAQTKFVKFQEVFTNPGSHSFTERELGEIYEFLTGEEPNAKFSDDFPEINDARSTLMTYIHKKTPFQQIPNGEFLFKKTFGLRWNDILSRVNNRIVSSKEWIKQYEKFNKYFS